MPLGGQAWAVGLGIPPLYIGLGKQVFCAVFAVGETAGELFASEANYASPNWPGFARLRQTHIKSLAHCF